MPDEQENSQNQEVAKMIRLSPDALFQEVAGEAVILDLNTSNYFGLEDVGCRFWQIIEEHGDFEIAVQALLQEYDVEEELLRQDLLALQDALVAADLLIID